MDSNCLKNALKLLKTCANCKREEIILFITDDSSKMIADIMWLAAEEFPNKTMLRITDRKMHGDEPPYVTAIAAKVSDVIFAITKFSMYHTDARRNAVSSGARWINMVDYDIDMMKEGGLDEDFIERGKQLDTVGKKLIGDVIIVETAAGTYLKSKISGRSAVSQYATSIDKGTTSAPPNIECAIGPLEGTSNGIMVVDGSIPHPRLGLIKEPITITVEDGLVKKIEGGKEADILRDILLEINENDKNIYNIGEIGIGMNSRSKLRGRMLEDEGCMGTMHIGIGSNITWGGVINSNNHLDLVIKDPTIRVDDVVLVLNGKILF
ncbi:MAG: hypothetical protein ABGF52_13295 [Candidatus Asgardarchaeum sp.]